MAKIRGKNQPVRAQRVLRVLSLVTALVTGGLLLSWPGYVVLSEDSSGQVTSDNLSLLAVNGPMVILWLAFPAVLCALAVLARGRARRILPLSVTLVLWAFMVLSSASIGGWFLPTAALLTLSLLPPAGG